MARIGQIDRGPRADPIRNQDGVLRGVLRDAPATTVRRRCSQRAATRLGLIPHPAAEPSQWVWLVEGPLAIITARLRGLPANRHPRTRR